MYCRSLIFGIELFEKHAQLSDRKQQEIIRILYKQRELKNKYVRWNLLNFSVKVNHPISYVALIKTT